MSKQALKRVRRALKMEVNRKPLDSFAWPGGYPLYYLFADGGVCCPKCANRNIDRIDEEMREIERFPKQVRRWELAKRACNVECERWLRIDEEDAAQQEAEQEGETVDDEGE